MSKVGFSNSSFSFSILVSLFLITPSRSDVNSFPKRRKEIKRLISKTINLQGRVSPTLWIPKSRRMEMENGVPGRRGLKGPAARVGLSLSKSLEIPDVALRSLALAALRRALHYTSVTTPLASRGPEETFC